MPHTHRAPRIRLTASAVSLGLLGAAALPLAATAAPDSAASGRSLTAPAEATANDGQAMNYAVNLVSGASQADLDTAIAAAEKLGAVPLATYPDLATFFAQSASGTFAGDLGNALAGVGVGFDSIGPTRGAAVTGGEMKVGDGSAGRMSRSAAGVQLDERSQFAQEGALDAVDPDPLTANAWGVLAIGAVEAQQVSVPLEPVTVGVLDSGIEATHEDLASQIDTSQSVGCVNNGLTDTSYEAWQPTTSDHGTHVAGTIAAAHNGLGVDGVAPSAKLASVKVVNDAGFIYPEYATCGFVWAGDHHFDVTNNSYYVDPWEYWVPTDPTQAAGLEAVTRAVAYADSQGVANVAAAGNSGRDLDALTVDNGSPNDVDVPIAGRDVTNGLDIPTMLDGVVAVSSVARPAGADPLTATLSRSSFSNYGVDTIDVAAPGSAIGSTITRNRYGSKSGTSMASPHTAGVLALIKAIHPDYTPAQAQDLLTKQAATTYDRLAVPTDGKEYRGAGLVNALAAVLKDQPQPVIGALEYSVDGGQTWAELDGAEASGTILVRASVTGPVTAATLVIGPGETPLAEASGVADGSFDGPGVALTAEVVLPEVDRAQPVSWTLDAQGRNADERADDDTAAEGSFAAVPVPESEPSETPEPSSPPSSPTGTSSSGPASPAGGSPSDLAETGADSTGLLALAAVVLLAGTATLVARRRTRA